MSNHFEWEGEKNCVTWLSRVPTEANVADYPSRFKRLEILTDDLGKRRLLFLLWLQCKFDGKFTCDQIVLWS